MSENKVFQLLFKILKEVAIDLC